MNAIFAKICLVLINMLRISYSYSINVGPNRILKYGNYNNGNVCQLNYNNVYSTFFKWSKDREEYSDKIIKDTIWLNKNRFSFPNIVIGIYNSDGDLNYICLLGTLSNGRFKMLNIFANPCNELDDDTILFENILRFCNENTYSINWDKLKDIENSKYYLSYLYTYNIYKP